MTATTNRQSVDPISALDAEPRRLPPSMVALAVLLVALFVAVVLAMVIAVAGDETPDAAGLEDFPLPAGVDLVGSMPTCTDQACDGLGIALTAAGNEDVAGLVATAWRDAGWSPRPCVDDGMMCFASGDLRISMLVWAEVDTVTVPKLVESIEAGEIDPNRVVFVHYYRCGSIYPCE